MQIHAFVSQVCREARSAHDTASVQRLVGTLRAAGFPDQLNQQDAASGKDLLLELLQRRTSSVRTAKLATSVPDGRMTPGKSDRPDDRFLEIEGYIEKGHCPRCKTPMQKVKLDSFKPESKEFLQTNYCQNCRTALWVR